MRVLTLINLIIFSIILLNQIYYIFEIQRISKNIDFIYEKIITETDINNLEFLILKRNYEISKFYYIYFVNFTFIMRYLYKIKNEYSYYELGEDFE